MMFAHNPTGETVRAEFFGHGTFEIEPGDTIEVPDAVARAWQDKNMWASGKCPLEFRKPGRIVARPKPQPPPPAAEPTEAPKAKAEPLNPATPAGGEKR